VLKALSSSGHACLDPPAGRCYLGDAGTAVERVEAADDQPACFEPVQLRGQGGLVQSQRVAQRQLGPARLDDQC
jgi:hypothetical protein